MTSKDEGQPEDVFIDVAEHELAKARKWDQISEMTARATMAAAAALVSIAKTLRRMEQRAKETNDKG